MLEREPSHGSVEVHYILQGNKDAAETGYRSAFIVPVQWNRKLESEWLPLSVLIQFFPFFGTYHFRLKVADTYGLSDYNWLDLGSTKEGDKTDVLSLARNLGYNEGNGCTRRPRQLFLKVLPLSFEATDTQIQSYEVSTGTEGGINWTNDDLGDPIPLLPVTSVTEEGTEERSSAGEIGSYSRSEYTHASGKTATVTNVGSVVKSIAKMGLGTAKKMVRQVNNTSRGRGPYVGTEGTFPSIDAMCALQEIASLLDEPYDPAQKSHIAILEEVWEGLFPGDKFPSHHPSPQWQYAGFKNDTILEENLYSTGLLALTSVSFFAKNHPSHVSRILREQSDYKRSDHYPFAVVACELTIMLADIFALRGGKFSKTKAVWWEILSLGVSGYYNVFCWSFLKLDLERERRKAVKSQFTSIMNSVRLELEKRIVRGVPPSIQDLEELGGIK